jgi:hypothetical protein
MYSIRWTEEAKADLQGMKLRAFEVSQIVDAVDQQLLHEPHREAKHRKIIRPGEELPFAHLDPVWQLSAREFRIFYDVTQGKAEKFEGQVIIRAVRRKPPHKTTKEIL